MSKASQVIVLCEDRLQEVFLCRFLKHGWGIAIRDIRVVPYPHGSGGAGEKHVRDRYPNELKAYRARSARAITILLVAIDADDKTVQTHQQELDEACGCEQPAVTVRQVGEAVVHVIPKWHIETWLAYLDGIKVSENGQYKASHTFQGRESDCHPLIDKLAATCRNGQQLTDPPDSLMQTCREFGRIRGLLRH